MYHPMSDIDILKEMIKHTATVQYEEQRVELIESSANTKYSMEIHGMPNPNDCIIIKTDAFPAPKSIFANTKHECKRADFVIIADTGNKKVIICLEMKAGKGEKEEIVQQLKGAQCFVAYCREIGRSFWDKQHFLDQYEYRFVSIRNISMPKRPTRNTKQLPIHNTPDKMLKVTNPKGLRFHQLVGRI